jgi:Activator of Hsp90 ATPase homolog 1-like protein
VLAFEPERLLRCTHWSPMGGSEDTPENYHTATYELAEDGGKTTLTLTQDNNATQEEPTTWPRTTGDRCCRASRRRPRSRLLVDGPSTSLVVENGTCLNPPTSVAPA